MKLVVDLPSALAGGVLVAVVGITLGAQSQKIPTSPTTLEIPTVIEHVVKVKGIPAPEEMVRVAATEPLTVPEGKRFVATGMAVLGTAGGSTVDQRWVEVRFDGNLVMQAAPYTVVNASAASGGGPSIPPIPPGLAAEPGTLVEVSYVNGNNAVLLGYLADLE